MTTTRVKDAASDPAVTVVVPVFNRDGELRRAIKSVLRQTLSDFECVVIDDASDHDIGAIVASYGDRRLRVVRRECNGGPYAARFTGMRVARGRYALFLDSDHELYPWALAQACRYLDEIAQVDMVSALFLRDEDSRLFVRVRNAPRIVTPEEACSEPGAPDRVSAVRRCVVEEWLEKRPDYFMFESHLSLTARLKHSVLYVDEPWTLYHVGGRDRVSQRRHNGREVEDYVRFVDEHWALIENGGPYVRLDSALKTAYFGLRRAHRPEAARVATALRMRGVSPTQALTEVALRKVQMRLGRETRHKAVWL